MPHFENENMRPKNIKEDLPENFRELTKKYAQNERDAAAQKIHILRESFYEQEKEILFSLNKLKEKSAEYKGRGLEMENLLEAYKNNINELKSSIFSRITERGKIKEVKGSIDYGQAQLEHLLSDKQEVDDDIGDLNRCLESRQQMIEAQRQLDEFYELQIEKFSEYQIKEKTELEEKLRLEANDIEAANVKNIIEKYDVSFIHGIRMAEDNLNTNPLIRLNVSWQDKLKTLIALEPEISSSAIRANYSESSFWVPFGAILNGGEVVTAKGLDMGTKATGIKKRDITDKPEKGKMSQCISSSIAPFHGRYNEFVIDNPSICGLFILEGGKGHRFGSVPSADEINQMEQDLKLPVYIICEGKYWLAEYNKDTKRYHKVKSVDNPAKTDTKIENITKKRIEYEVFNNFPLQVEEWQEFGNIESAASGRILYSQLGAYQKLKDVKGVQATFNNNSSEIISSFNGAGKKYNIYRNNQGSRASYLLTVTDSVNKIERAWKNLDPESVKGSCLWMGQGNWTLDKPIQGIRDYVEAVQSTMENIEERIKTKQLRRGEKLEFLKWILNKLAYHAHGFAKQASECGDSQAAEAAVAVAKKIVSLEEYEEVLSRRIGPNGEMKVVEEDLKKLN